MIKLTFLIFLGSFAFMPFASADTAIFAGGCFWCMQPPFDALKSSGVLSTRVGYTGGTTENPTYKETSEGKSGHREAIEIVYDSQKISYKKLLEVFWKNIDPFDPQGQFCDKGIQYSSAIFYTTEEQRKEAEASRPKGKVETLILPAKKFYPAEEYHQSYYTKNPIRYKFYRFNCGRDKRLKEVWEMH
ncbi:MAG: peptide-methionine (S)-S-oxide reductase MsrA [Bacteriovorax sp.]